MGDLVESDPANPDIHDLQRFVDAQQAVYPTVIAELAAGRKRSHWMWFIFPQLAGLGSSAMAHRYAIKTAAEARAYSRHPILGQRLRECCELVYDIKDRSVEDIFGYPDNLKFHSCMTLFAHAAPDADIFRHCLEQFFAGNEDAETLRRL